MSTCAPYIFNGAWNDIMGIQKQLKWLLSPEHSSLGIPGPVFCLTILMCKL